MLTHAVKLRDAWAARVVAPLRATGSFGDLVISLYLRCWSDDFSRRPSMGEIRQKLSRLAERVNLHLNMPLMKKRPWARVSVEHVFLFFVTVSFNFFSPSSMTPMISLFCRKKMIQIKRYVYCRHVVYCITVVYRMHQKNVSKIIPFY